MPSYSVGTQYVDASASESQVVVPPRSELGVVAAFVERLPMYVWLCESPGRPANTIASSLFR